MSSQQLSERISEYLYKYLEGDDTDMPVDEYIHEAEALVEFIELSSGQPCPVEISAKLRPIFIDRLNYDYGENAFLEAGQAIEKLNKIGD